MVKNITSDNILYVFHEKDIFISASIIKIPIMLSILDHLLNNNISIESYIK